MTTLRVPRLSGAEDFLPITISERLLIDEPLAAGSMLCMEGQLRSYNKVIEGAGRLLITAFAQRILNCESMRNPNRVQLTGALCLELPHHALWARDRGPDAGGEPFYGKSDYIPASPGADWRYAAKPKIGDRVQLVGRFQSRAYQKQLPTAPPSTRVAYEVSVSRLNAVREEPRPDLFASAANASPGALTGAGTVRAPGRALHRPPARRGRFFLFVFLLCLL